MDRAEFEAIVHEHKDAIFGFATYLVGRKEDAEDIVQNVFISLWNHKEEIEAASVRWWLLRVCKNACLDLLRRRKVRLKARAADSLVGRGRMGIEIEESDGRERTLDVSDLGAGALHAEQNVDIDRLCAAMQDLREPYRSVVLLRETQDLSYEEIASMLDMSLSAVKVTLHRARRFLREAFTDVQQAEANP